MTRVRRRRSTANNCENRPDEQSRGASAVYRADACAAPPSPPPLIPAGCFEVKWDGIRAQLRVDHGRVTLRTRPGRDATSDFPELAELGAALRGRHPMWVIRGDSGASMFDARARDGRASRTAWGLRESEDEQIDGE